MHEGYTPPEIIAAATRESVEKRFSRPSRQFDPELFMEGYDALAIEFERADAATRRRILVERYFDPFEPIEDPRIDDSEFEDRFIVRPPELTATSESGVEEEHLTKLLGDSSRANIGREYAPMWQYGPSRIFDLPAGNFIEVEALGPQDVVGTTALSACTAIVARKESRAFLAHVRGSHGETIKAVLERLAARGYRPESTRLFSPFWTEAGGRTVDMWNDRLTKLSESSGVRVDWFPYVGSDTLNPDDIRHTTVLVGASMLRSVGTSYAYHQAKSRPGDAPSRRTVIRPATIRDYE